MLAYRLWRRPNIWWASPAFCVDVSRTDHVSRHSSINSFGAGINFRRQILTSKVDLRSERI